MIQKFLMVDLQLSLYLIYKVIMHITQLLYAQGGIEEEIGAPVSVSEMHG